MAKSMNTTGNSDRIELAVIVIDNRYRHLYQMIDIQYCAVVEDPEKCGFIDLVRSFRRYVTKKRRLFVCSNFCLTIDSRVVILVDSVISTLSESPGQPLPTRIEIESDKDV